MKVKLKSITPDIEPHIIEVARVSSSRKNKRQNYARLINYLINNEHWSPFEHGFITFEIETSKAIGIQLIRHRSFTFQEFSQRYQDVRELGEMFEDVELRRQADDNRQSSTEVFDPSVSVKSLQGEYLGYKASTTIDDLLNRTQELYKELLEAGVARECARMILPMCTKTRIHMTGSVRSWIHFLDLRDNEHAQKEIQLIAKEIKNQLSKELPTITEALKWKS